jgi:conjugative relaxase-like TrwC/TraI family protein
MRLPGLRPGWWGGGGVIDPAKLTAGREDYYLREVAEDREAYLTGHGEAPGYTLGTAWAHVGISGTVSAEQFTRVFAGRHPHSGELLGRRHRTDGVLAYDLVFRPVKSVSLLYGLFGREASAAALRAHQAGVRQAMAFLEGQVGLRRGRNGAMRVMPDGLLAVGFDHRTSRAGDPLLHTHVILVNRAPGPDERWTALDGEDLFRERMALLMAADAKYRATYQHELTRSLGISWGEPDAMGNREIAGMPNELVRLYSKAREAIEIELEHREAAGLAVSAKVANWIAHKVRQAKHHEPIPTLWGRWMEEAREAGFDLSGLARTLTGHRHRTLLEADIAAAFDRLASPQGLTREASTFGKVQVIRALADTALFGPERLEPLTDRFLAERCLRVATDEKSARGAWSTPELLELERRLVDDAQARRSEPSRGVPQAVLDAVVEHHAAIGRPLGPDQETALRSLCAADTGVALLRGRAGTGKTATMDAVRTAFDLANHLLPEHDRVQVRGMAPTGIAAIELSHGAAVPTVTVDRFLLDLNQGRDQLTAHDVVIIDEANMLGTRKAAPLFAHARRVGAKMIVLGDNRQLQSIPTGGWFRGLLARLAFAELTENRRQLDELDRQAVELIRNGAPDEAMALYRDGGRVTVTRTAAEADQAQIADWWAAFAAGDNAVMLAFRRREVDRLNDLAHAAMNQAGRLTGDSLEIQGRQFQVGDRVVCGLNRLHDLGIANGTRGWITALNREEHSVTIRLDGDGGHEVTLPAGYLRRRLGESRRPLDHAYAITGHRAEGVTVDRAFVRGGGPDQEFGYVVMTRVRHRADIYLVETPTPNRSDGAEELGDLPPAPERDPYAVAVAALGRSNPKRMAIDIEQDHAPPAPGTMTTTELRAERDRLDRVLASQPRPEAHAWRRTLHRATELHARADELAERIAEREAWLAEHGRGMAALTRREQIHAARADLAHLTQRRAVLETRLAETERRERALLRHEQQRAAWAECHAGHVDRHRAVLAELGWRSRAQSAARTVDAPEWLANVLGEVPDSVRGRRAWRAAAETIERYRERHRITADGLGGVPDDLGQYREWRACHDAMERLHDRTRDRERQCGMSRGIS